MADQETQQTREGDSRFIVLVAFCMFISVVTLFLAVGLSVYADTVLADSGKNGEGLVTRSSIERLWQAFSAALGVLFGLLAGKRL